MGSYRVDNKGGLVFIEFLNDPDNGLVLSHTRIILNSKFQSEKFWDRIELFKSPVQTESQFSLVWSIIFYFYILF